MNKLLLTTILLSCITFISSAQSKLPTDERYVSLGVEIGPVTGHTSTGMSYNFGASLQFDIPIIFNTDITIASGYNVIKSKERMYFVVPGAGAAPAASAVYYGETVKFVPVKLGLKHHISSLFFLEGEAGSALPIGADDKASFIYSLGGGFDFKDFWQIGLRFESLPNNNSISYIAGRLAYRF